MQRFYEGSHCMVMDVPPNLLLPTDGVQKHPHRYDLQVHGGGLSQYIQIGKCLENLLLTYLRTLGSTKHRQRIGASWSYLANP